MSDAIVVRIFNDARKVEERHIFRVNVEYYETAKGCLNVLRWMIRCRDAKA